MRTDVGSADEPQPDDAERHVLIRARVQDTIGEMSERIKRRIRQRLAQIGMDVVSIRDVPADDEPREGQPDETLDTVTAGQEEMYALLAESAGQLGRAKPQS